jgi:hypothetical protein
MKLIATGNKIGEKMTNLGKLEKVDLRKVWADEAGVFTPWLAQEENIKLLGDTIGIELKVEAQEKPVGPFSADILCKDTVNNQWVLIENQLERTDHTHLGQLMTYAAGLDAVTIIWIAQRFTDEHRAAMDWLNEITEEDIVFFGLEIELWQISGSPVAPKFNIISKPNEWSKTIKRTARQWDEATFMKALESNKGLECVRIAKEILEWATGKFDRIWWGKGNITGSFIPVLGSERGGKVFISFWTNGSVETGFQWLAYQNAFKDEESRKELVKRLNNIPGVNFSEDVISGKPSFPMEKLADEKAMAVFKEIFEWVIDKLRAQ